jgi:hypothetical protein
MLRRYRVVRGLDLGAKPIASIAIKMKSAEREEGEAKEPKVDGDYKKA